MNRNLFYMLFIFLPLLMGCEYQLGENFIEVEKPAGEIDMSIELNADNDGQKIVISEENTMITYNLNISGHKLITCIFTLGNRQWTTESASGTFLINKGEFADGEYTLKCDLYAHTGSGSIADQIGQESYFGSNSWPVEVVTYNEPAYSLEHKINADGYLELSWKKPLLNESAFDYYRVYGGGLDIKITDRNQLSYVCKSYIGQMANYQVSVCFKNNGSSWMVGFVNMEVHSPEITYDDSDPDSLQINIKRTYKSVMNIEYNGMLLAGEYNGDFVRLPYTDFGAPNLDLTLGVIPFDKADRIEGSTLRTYNQVPASPGVCIAPLQNWARFGYNQQEDVLYVSSYGEITNWLLPDAIRYKEYKGSDGDNINQYAQSLYSSQMAARHDKTIDLLDGKNMQRVRTITLDHSTFASFAGGMAFTKEGKLICLVDDFQNASGRVYRASDGVLESTFSFPEYTNVHTSAFSADGRYLGYDQGDKSGLTVITLENNQIASTKKLDRSFSTWCMNPCDAGQLIVSSEGKIYLYNCSDLSLVSTLDYQGMIAGNVDPKTGYLLLRGEQNIQVVDLKTNTLLYTKRVASYSECKLYGNMLISNNGFALNIEKHLKR